MAVLCQLADPQSYRAFDWNLVNDPGDFGYWHGLFADFPERIERMLRDDELTGDHFDRRWSAFRGEYDAGMARWREDPWSDGEMTTVKLCEFRQAMLIRHGWPDPYVRVKARENDKAVALYRNVVDSIDRLGPEDRWEALLRGLWAGNMFDLGAPASSHLYDRGELDFQSTLDRIPPRRWTIDHADALRERFWPRPRYRQVLFFVDNAGSDIVLGALPLIREWARLGSRVVVAANTRPALNDITLDELNALIHRLAAMDPGLADLLAGDCIATVASGGEIPLIDLARISDECDRAAAGSDLIVLEGMGRGVESNWRQPFRCDVWRAALIKDECVARWTGTKLWEPICRFDPAGGPRAA